VSDIHNWLIALAQLLVLLLLRLGKVETSFHLVDLRGSCWGCLKWQVADRRGVMIKWINWSLDLGLKLFNYSIRVNNYIGWWLPSYCCCDLRTQIYHSSIDVLIKLWWLYIIAFFFMICKGWISLEHVVLENNRFLVIAIDRAMPTAVLLSRWSQLNILLWRRRVIGESDLKRLLSWHLMCIVVVHSLRQIN